MRWTIAAAAAEFGVSTKTVSSRLKTAGIVPGKDHHFSTIDMVTAIYGDYEKERTRRMTEQADALALANARERGHLVDAEDFMRRLEQVTVQMKARILSSSLSEGEQDALLADLASYFKNAVV